MCGIAAAAQPHNVVHFLSQAIQKMEYRGYDSYGVAVQSAGQTRCIKGLGSITEAGVADPIFKLAGNVGISHTRWATQGEVRIRNAHPIPGGLNPEFPTCYVVHNGNVTNKMELTRFLCGEGYKFQTETDTEVIAHLFDFYYREIPSDILSFTQVMRSIMLDLQGQCAFAVLARNFPSMIGAVCNGAPLIISPDGYLASDPKALSGYTEKAYRLLDGDSVVFRRNYVSLFNSYQFFKLEDRPKVAILTEKVRVKSAAFPHEMLREIHEQPALVKRELRPVFSNLKWAERIILFGCGSSYNAARLGRHYIESIAGIPCQVEYSSDFQSRYILYPPDTLFIALTQSGETRDTILAMESLKKEFCLLITNEPSSKATQLAHRQIFLGAGTEIGVAATKTFTMQVLRLIQLALYLAPNEKLSSELLNLPDAIKTALDSTGHIQSAAKVVQGFSNLIFLGRSCNYAVVKEAALKMKEVSYVPSEAIHAAEMKHGPLALIDGKTLGILIDGPTADEQERVLINAKEIQARGGKLLVVAAESSELSRLADWVIPLPLPLNHFQPLVSNVVLQLLAYYVAVGKGLNPDRPRSLAKSVTVE